MRNYTICVAKTKALINCAVTAQLICPFVFAQATIRFSRDAAQMFSCVMANTSILRWSPHSGNLWFLDNLSWCFTYTVNSQGHV